MIIYSVEITIKKDIAQKWLHWMQTHHIPDVMNTGLFIEFDFFQNLFEPLTYTIQYKLKNIDHYSKYRELYAENLQKEHSRKFENKFSAKRKMFTHLDLDD